MFAMIQPHLILLLPRPLHLDSLYINLRLMMLISHNALPLWRLRLCHHLGLCICQIHRMNSLRRRTILIPIPLPPPPAVVVPKVRPPPQSPSNPRRVLKKSFPPSTKCLPKNDLRHRLIAGAVPSNVTDDDVEVESTRCYLKGQHDLLVKLKRVC